MRKWLCILCVMAFLAGTSSCGVWEDSTWTPLGAGRRAEITGTRSVQENIEEDDASQEPSVPAAETVAQTLYEAVENNESEVTFRREEYSADWDDMDTLINDAVKEINYNSPEISWKLSSEWGYISDGSVTTVELNYIAAADELRQMQAEIEAEAEAVLGMLQAETDLWDQLLLLHDYLCTHIVYQSGSCDQTLYGALVLGQCVCAGYANAEAYFLDLLGVDNRIVIGTATNDMGENETHAWNRISVEDRFYYMDVTWDDTDTWSAGEEVVLHDYFMVSAAALRSHTSDDPQDMPADGCTEGDMNYHVREGCYLSGYDRDAVAAIISSQFAAGEMPITFRLADAQSYLDSENDLADNDALGSILSSLGWQGGYSWFTLDVEGDEVYVWNILLE